MSSQPLWLNRFRWIHGLDSELISLRVECPIMSHCAACGLFGTKMHKPSNTGRYLDMWRTQSGVSKLDFIVDQLCFVTVPLRFIG